PYPRYPLLAKPRWQDGHLAATAFAAALARAAGVRPAVDRATGAAGGRERIDVLIGGAGEILPYVIRKWEPRRHRVVALDLSATSLRRARWRLFPLTRPTAFV